VSGCHSSAARPRASSICEVPRALSTRSPRTITYVWAVTSGLNRGSAISGYDITRWGAIKADSARVVIQAGALLRDPDCLSASNSIVTDTEST
jgi:hypothetical protein